MIFNKQVRLGSAKTPRDYYNLSWMFFIELLYLPTFLNIAVVFSIVVCQIFENN